MSFKRAVVPVVAAVAVVAVVVVAAAALAAGAPTATAASRPSSAPHFAERADLAATTAPAVAGARVVVPAGQLIEPTAPMKVTGAGFPARARVAVSIDTVDTARVTLIADARGAFATRIYVPARTKPGRHVITATTAQPTPAPVAETGGAPASAGVSARATVTVHTNWPAAFGNAHVTNSSPTENAFGPAAAADLEPVWSIRDDSIASSIVVDGIAYLSQKDRHNTDPTNPRGYFRAVDADTGATLWEQRVPVVPAAVVVGDEVWFSDSYGSIDINDRFTGADRGRVDIDDGCSSAGCLVEFDGTVYLMGSVGTSAIDEKTHAYRRGYMPYGSGRYGQPFADGKVFFSGIGVSAWDLQTGNKLWSIAGPQGEETGVGGAPAVGNGLVYVSWGTDSSQLAAYRPFDGQLVWITPLGAHLGGGTISLVGTTIYVIAGTADDFVPIHALDALTGKALWTSDVRVGATEAMTTAGGVILAPIEDEASNGLDFGAINAATGHLIARYPFGLGPREFSNVAVADGRLYYTANNGKYTALAGPS